MRFSTWWVCCGVMIGLAMAQPRQAHGQSPPAPAQASNPADRPATRPADPAEALIAALGDPDPAVRQQSIDALRELGAAARPALRRAARSRNPAVRAAAGQLLQEIPFDRPDDPPQMRTLLRRYTQQDPAGRMQIVQRLADQRDSEGLELLIRLVEDEPDYALRWSIVGAIRRSARRIDYPRLQQIVPEDDCSPVLVLVGWAWLLDDHDKAMTFFAQAARAEAQRPTLDGGGMDFAFRMLAHHWMEQERHADVAALLRQQIARRPAPIAERGDLEHLTGQMLWLLRLHLYHGPIQGAEQDLGLLRPYMGHAPMIVAVGKLLEDSGWPEPAEAMYRQAYLFSPQTPRSLHRSAVLMMEHGWFDQAEPALRAAVAMDDPDPDDDKIRARLMLKELAERRGDDQETGEQLRRLLEEMEGRRMLLSQTDPYTGRVRMVEPESLWAQVHWRLLRAAMAKGDKAATEKHLDDLVNFRTQHMDLVLEVVPLLKQRNRIDDAKRVFQGAYDDLKQRLDEEPDNPEHMNNLAWLLARCDEDLDEALKLASDAIAAVPDNAAYLDTLAEVHFRRGNKAEAIRLEKRALELRPGDEFMRQQLERFSQ